MSFRSQA